VPFVWGHSISSHCSGNGSLRSKSWFAGLTRTAAKRFGAREK
jgi:hypothetical protein